MTKREKHSHLVPAGHGYWWTDRLWAAAADLPIQTVPIDSIAEFDMDCWFRGKGPTCREVAEHARRINAADLRYPVILSADGSLMDGGHRIAKAFLLGEQTIRARRFVTDPEPDWIVPAESNRPGQDPGRCECDADAAEIVHEGAPSRFVADE